MKLRSIIFWAHLGAGVVAGLVVLIMSVTGVLLMYERQLTTWADGHRVSPPEAGAARLPVETLLARVRASESNASPSSITFESDTHAPVAFGFGRERTVFVNPYTGDVLGEGSARTRAFFHFVTDWHRWLGMHDEKRATGKAITGACNLAFLFLVVSGFYLWWPRQWTWRAFRTVLTFDGRLRGRARDWNWHNVIGSWCAVPLFLVVFTAVFFSYPWATTALYRLTGNEPPPSRQAPGGRSGGEQARGGGRGEAQGRTRSSEGADPFAGFEKLWARAEEKVPGWQTISCRLSSPGSPVSFTIYGSHRGRPDKRAQLTLNARTGEVEKWETYGDSNSAQKVRAWVRWIHTGEAGGFIGQTIAGAASAGAAVLVWTGLALSWRRLLGRKRATTTGANAQEEKKEVAAVAGQ